MTHVQPELPTTQGDIAKKDADDYWVEGWTAGQEGVVYINGRKQKNVVAVETKQIVGGATTVTITYLARSLNKGKRPA